ncbi:MAG: glutathione S-transferase C-terminal domain-containing protein [Methylobacteriaceae bacterium]|nr:glutathione S-transferase C-terminal domain-containing protein [Methylobacteriaceae bacterium]
MTDHTKLYCFGESGNAFKAAFMLSACGLDWTPVVVDFFNGETRTPAYRAEVNEMGEVPVLVHGGRKLAQSGVILTYLAEVTGQFGPRDGDEQLELLRWLLFDNHKFTSYVATLRFLVALAKTGETPVTEFLRGRAVAAAAIVDKHLAETPWLVGGRPTIADLSLSGYLFYPEQYGVDWTGYANIARWLDRLRALPGWKPPYEMMPKAPARRG